MPQSCGMHDVCAVWSVSTTREISRLNRPSQRLPLRRPVAASGGFFGPGVKPLNRLWQDTAGSFGRQKKGVSSPLELKLALCL